MEGDTSPPPSKKLKVDDSIEDEGAEAVGPDPVDNQHQQPRDGGMARSPITVPMLVPEMWEKAFGFLPSSDLITILNTCPEWNHLLTSQKQTILLPKVLELMSLHLPRKDFLACRLINKACKAGIDLAYPEIPQTVEVHRIVREIVEEMPEVREGLIPLEQLIRVCVPFLLQAIRNSEEEEPAQENELHGD